ncbi:MAG TPA: hypothetical protein VGD22_20245 [Sphingobacteriaceae bacterium]
MKESVDKNLKEHIIKVFDQYEDSGADHGWLELRKKYPAKSARRPIIWWSSAAAILVFAGSLFFLNTQNQDEQTIISKNQLKKVQEATSTNKNSGLTIEKTPELKNVNQSKHDIALAIRKPAKTIASGPSVSDIHNNAKATADFNEPIISSEKESGIEVASLNILSQEPAIKPVPEEELRTHTDQPLIQENDIESNKPIIGSHSFLAEKKPDILGDKKVPLIEKNEDLQNKRMELTFYAGPFFNYAEGSSTSMNLGAGVSSGISLSKRVTLIAGLALAKNTLVFDSEVPANSYVAFLNSTPLDQKSQNLLATSSVAQISKFEAQLLNLDIPVNIKYSLSREPDKVFVTAGLSSFTYLNEAYRYSYNYLTSGSNSFSSGSSSNDKVINKNFGKFDLAQTLNLSFGFTHTAKVQRFVIEPFIKYPLGTLGSQNIRFGSAGINFKLSIHPAEKFTK